MKGKDQFKVESLLCVGLLRGRGAAWGVWGGLRWGAGVGPADRCPFIIALLAAAPTVVQQGKSVEQRASCSRHPLSNMTYYRLQRQKKQPINKHICDIVKTNSWCILIQFVTFRITLLRSDQCVWAENALDWGTLYHPDLWHDNSSSHLYKLHVFETALKFILQCLCHMAVSV